MHRLSHLDQIRVLDAIREVHRQTESDALRAVTVRVAADLISGDFGSFNLISKTTSRILASLRIPDVSRIVDPHLPAFAAYFHEHPILRFAQRTGRLDAQRFTDVVVRSEWESTRLHNEYLRPIGIRHQMIVSFDRPDRNSVAVSINRSRREFSERDVTVFNLLRPHLAQAHENVAQLERTRAVANNLENSGEPCERGILVADSQHRILWISNFARRALLETLQGDFGPDSLLPEQLCGWLDVRRKKCSDIDSMRGPPAPLPIGRTGNKVIIQQVAEDPDGNVTLLLGRAAGGSRNPRALPELTIRENDVLRWIAEGKSNPEIATILGLSVRTVYKHVENIFAKLGVENRSCAILRALRCG
jgi:DNA-binding CsgD family transcriptional regulator